MVECGVPNSSILREPIAKNTGTSAPASSIFKLAQLLFEPLASQRWPRPSHLLSSPPLPGDNFNLTRVPMPRLLLHLHLSLFYITPALGALLIERDIPLPTRTLVVTKPYM